MNAARTQRGATGGESTRLRPRLQLRGTKALWDAAASVQRGTSAKSSASCARRGEQKPRRSEGTRGLARRATGESPLGHG